MQGDGQGTLIFKFIVQPKNSTSELLAATLSLVEMTSSSVKKTLDTSKIKKIASIPYNFRVLDAVYQGGLMRSLQTILQPTQKTCFAYIFNVTGCEDVSSDCLLQVSQLMREQETITGQSNLLAKDRVSSGIKMILSKKSANKGDSKLIGDKQTSIKEEIVHKKQHLR